MLGLVQQVQCLQRCNAWCCYGTLLPTAEGGHVAGEAGERAVCSEELEL